MDKEAFITGHFKALNVQNSQLLVLKSEEERVSRALLHNEGCIPAGVSGRSEICYFPLDDGGQGVLRICRRGGLIHALLKDRYLFVNRPLRDFEVHAQAEEEKLPVPPLLGVLWRRKGLAFSGALATRRLEGLDLDSWLSLSERGEEERATRLFAAGSLIRECHDRGLFHADLNVKNIFVEADRLRLLDFDRSRFYPRLGRIRQARNLLRLRRSFHKRGHGEEAFQSLLSGYGNFSFPLWLIVVFYCKNLLSDLFQRKRDHA